jgi:SAM-dependent methyltransferase
MDSGSAVVIARSHDSQRVGDRRRATYEYYTTPRSVGSDTRTIYEIWENGEAFNDSVTPSTYVSEYRALIVEKIMGLTRRGSQVVSIGCGNGFVERDLMRAEREIVAIDCNEEAVRMTRSKGVHALVLDFFDLKPSHVATASVIYGDGLLGHLFDPQAHLDPTIHLLLSLQLASGTCVVLSNDAPPNPAVGFMPHEAVEGFWFIEREYLHSTLQAAGFEVTSEYFEYMRPLSGPRQRTICVARVP